MNLQDIRSYYNTKPVEFIPKAKEKYTINEDKMYNVEDYNWETLYEDILLQRKLLVIDPILLKIYDHQWHIEKQNTNHKESSRRYKLLFSINQRRNLYV